MQSLYLIDVVRWGSALSFSAQITSRQKTNPSCQKMYIRRGINRRSDMERTSSGKIDVLGIRPHLEILERLIKL